MSDWPHVCTVIPTRDRPELLGRAVAAALAQDYPGRHEVVVVLDQPPETLQLPEVTRDPRVTVLENSRRPGLPGARNTGICSTAADLVAFCDDDDVWLPGRLQAQVHALRASPGSCFATCAVRVNYDGRRTPRLAGRGTVTHSDLLPKRMAMLHSSTFLIDRRALVDRIGLLSEDAPSGQNEDWDLLLRATQHGDIVHVDEPLVEVTWWKRSFFSGEWDSKIASLLWMLERHPDIGTNRSGSARVFGQIAFAHAASGRRGSAVRWAGRSIGRRWREPRAYLSLATAAGVPPDTVLQLLHRRGRGI